jgi:hypothetical protein
LFRDDTRGERPARLSDADAARRSSSDRSDGERAKADRGPSR